VFLAVLIFYVVSPNKPGKLHGINLTSNPTPVALKIQEMRTIAMTKRSSRMMDMKSKSIVPPTPSSVPTSNKKIESKLDPGMFFFEQENQNKVIKLELSLGSKFHKFHSFEKVS